MKRKLIGILMLSMVMFANLLLTPTNVFAKEKELTAPDSKIEVNMTADKYTLESGDQINFRLAYKASEDEGSVKPGDQITFEIPKWLKNFEIEFPQQHFKDVVVKGNEVVATFGDNVESSINGYINIWAIVGYIESRNTETIDLKVNGNVVSNMDLSFKPKEEEPKSVYTFEVKNVDAEHEDRPLIGSKFVLKNKEKKVIKQLTSDENGVIKSQINEIGTYYLQQIEVPKGYTLEHKEIEFKVSENDIEKTIKLDNITNEKLKNTNEIKEHALKEELEKIKKPLRRDKVDPKETESTLVEQEVRRPQSRIGDTTEQVDPKLKRAEFLKIERLISETISGAVKEVPIPKKIDTKEVESGLVKNESKRLVVHVAKPIEEVPKQPLVPEKVESKEIESGLIKKEARGPEIPVVKTTEEVPKEVLIPEKIESKEIESGLVKKEVRKLEVPVVKSTDKVETKEQASVSSNSKNPKTGDSSMFGYIITLASVSICGLAINRKKK